MRIVCKTERSLVESLQQGRSHTSSVALLLTDRSRGTHAEVALAPAAHPRLTRVSGKKKNAQVAIAVSFGRNLARCRKRAGLSQEELAVRASLHRTAVGQLERGERVARVDTLIKLAGSLGIPPGELLDGMGWEPGETRIGQFSSDDSDAPAAQRAA